MCTQCSLTGECRERGRGEERERGRGEERETGRGGEGERGREGDGERGRGGDSGKYSLLAVMRVAYHNNGISLSKLKCLLAYYHSVDLSLWNTHTHTHTHTHASCHCVVLLFIAMMRKLLVTQTAIHWCLVFGM